MSILEASTLIGACGAFMTSMATLVNSFKNTKKLEVLHELTNGLSEKRVDAEKGLSHAEGKAEGIAQQKEADKG